MNEHLQHVAQEYASRLPTEDAKLNECLARLCFLQEPLMRVADTLKPPTTDEEFAMVTAIEYALGCVLRAGRTLVITAAAQDISDSPINLAQ